MHKGLKINRKPKEAPPEPGPDLTSTSRARQTLAHVRKHGTPEQVADIEKQVSEAYPDVLVSRRRVQ